MPRAELFRQRRWTVTLCAALLLVFAGLGWSAVSRKSPTFDESYHAMAGWFELWHGEYRFDSEDPPLCTMLGAALAGPGSVRVDASQINWSILPLASGQEYQLATRTLYDTPGNNGAAFIAKFRAVMLGVGLALGVLLAAFVWKLAHANGAAPAAAGAGAVLATALFALDPNFLAHAPLMKNDVASALALLGLTASTWAAGRGLTWRRTLALGMWSGIAMTVKFTGPLLVGSSAVLLVLRALLPWGWTVQIRRGMVLRCDSRLKRTAAAAINLAVMGVMAFATVWGCYRLRFAPASAPGASMNMPSVVAACTGQVRALAKSDDVPEPMLARLASWANDEHLLPQAYLAGLLDVYQGSQTRDTFLLGRHSITGHRWYFPFAMAVKTPITTLAVLLMATVVGAINWLGRGKNFARLRSRDLQIRMWTALCLIVPAAIYLNTATRSNMNLGLRHILPIYPLLFAGAGLAMSRVWNWRPKAAMAVGVLIIAGLAMESLAAYPNYIPFFNFASGGSRGGLRLLSDSNLDWGQDLPLLAAWQRAHPAERLYLSYFGACEAEYYGIRCKKLADRPSAGTPAQQIKGASVIAISATALQGTYNRAYWSDFWSLKPFDVLGGSIYLFRVPPRPDDYLPDGKQLID